MALCSVCIGIPAQPPGIKFRSITVKEGLNDGLSTKIASDKYGYLWFATSGGLNQFNGSVIKKFTNIPGDSTSPPAGLCYSIAGGSDGKLWIGYWNELYQFGYSSSAFKKMKSYSGIHISSIITEIPGKLFLATYKGLLCFNISKDIPEEVAADSSAKRITSLPFFNAVYAKNKIYAGATGGYIIYDTETRRAEWRPVKELNGLTVNKIFVTKSGDTWLANNEKFKLICVKANGLAEIHDEFLLRYQPGVQAGIYGFAESSDNFIWLATNNKGLLCYNNNTGKLIQYKNDPDKKNSLLAGNLNDLYKTPDGTIWTATNSGISYFNPDKNLFRVIYPFSDKYNFPMGRGVTEDKDGNLWFTTGNGIVKYNPSLSSYKEWQNQPGKPDVIYFNSVRGIVQDMNDDILVATGRGVNRINPKTEKIEFLTIKDSIPQGFYFSANKTSDGTVWFGTRDYDGLYYYNPRERKFHGIAGHPVLKKFKGYTVRYVFEDSKRRLWFGYNDIGLTMYEPATGKTQYWNADVNWPNTIIGNIIYDIKEDKSGVIWVTTNNGLTAINTEQNKFTSYNEKNGLHTNISGGVAVDSLNRIWVGTAAGLTMLDESRKSFTWFGTEWGLDVTDFNEHPAITLKNGNILIPSMQGYVLFNPLNYSSEAKQLSCYISSLRIFGKEEVPYYDFKQQKKLRLAADENFFTLELEALNFDNAGQTWFAYKLDGLESNWHFTQDPKAVYTNVPGGKYTFMYKAAVNVNNWNAAEEKQLILHIDTVFYKAKWFWILIALVTVSLIYFLYRFRIDKQKQVHELESKARILEKEKAQVLYEGLKQQLNPHFLFNSLTSLSGLIRTDQKLAGGFLKQMSKIYRYILQSRDSETVLLKEEIVFVQTYIDLQITRFKNGLQVNIQIDEDSQNKRIPPVTLQNMLENAIKHNIIDTDSPLVVDIFTENGYLIIKNNLQKKHIVETSNKQGLASLQSLYQFLSAKKVIIEEDADEFRIKLPLI